MAARLGFPTIERMECELSPEDIEDWIAAALAAGWVQPLDFEPPTDEQVDEALKWLIPTSIS